MSLCDSNDFLVHHTAAFYHNTGFFDCIVVLFINLLHKDVHDWHEYCES